MRWSGFFWIGLALLAIGAFAANADAPKAAVLLSGLPDADPAVGNALEESLRGAGYTVTPFSFDDLCDSARLSTAQVDLLALPDAAALPINATAPVEAFLRAGGDIIALNAPMWQRQLIRDDSGWMDRDAYQRKYAGTLLQRRLFSFTAEEIADWRRNTNDFSTLTTHAPVDVGEGLVDTGLHVTISCLNNWDTFTSPMLEQPFQEGHTLTVFFAKGGPQTTELSVEWEERDGSRWIATAPLTHEWRQLVLAPEDFHFWESVPARAGTRFNPAEAVRCSIGLALSHTRLSGDKHAYWLGPFGTAARTPDHERMLTSFTPPLLDILSPGYKFFPSRDTARLLTPFGVGLPEIIALEPPATLYSPHPRPKAGGFDKGRAWRWQPILQARSPEGIWRGTPATIMAHADGPWKGGVWVSFGIGETEWLTQPAVQEIIRQVAARVRRGVFFVDAGANYYTYFEGQSMRLGARVANVSRESVGGLALRIHLLNADTGETAHQAQWDLHVPAGETIQQEEVFQPAQWPEKGFRVIAELLEGGVVFDRAEHEAHVWRPKQDRSYITAENGRFMLNSQPWRAHGVNYMPSSGVATEDGAYFEYWLGARSYDPQVIDRDLAHIVNLGLNSVSIFIYHQSLDAQNLLDLLRRLDNLGLKANLSLRPGTPMDFEWEKMRELIEYYRLPEHDCVFALDLAWEPMFGDHDARRRWDPEWRAWVTDRYGSIENAEKDWGFAGPRDADGHLTNPLGEHIIGDGPWRVMTAAYRRFLDTLLYEKYSAARDLVRSVDPVHLVSFRMAEAGNPTFRWDKAIPYDFAYLAGAVDLLEPEAYGRIGDWEKVKPGWVTFEYARWAGPHLPMVWAEMGVHAWVESQMRATPERLQFQADYYTHFYRMITRSGADGIFFWWYPGGYRVGERSDYGIIEPDGLDRPVSRVIRENAQAYLRAPQLRPVDHFIEFDRDLHPEGLIGIYEAAQKEFWQAIEDGQTPGLKTAGSGTSSADCPLIAVGNTPHNGSNPPKFLDAFFNRVEIKGIGTAANGGQTRISGDGSTLAQITVTNLGEAQWLSPSDCDGPGRVWLVLYGPDGVEARRVPLSHSMGRFGQAVFENVPLHDGALLEEKSVTLRMWAEDRAFFGPSFTIRLLPQ